MYIESLVLENTLLSMMIRFSVNFITLFILIRLIYYHFTKKAEFLFSYFLMGIVIFFICAILQTVDIQLGMALGLFAIFAILRFRTVNYSVKDMTYVFAVIGVSVINSQANLTPPVLGAILLNSIILITALILEIFLNKRQVKTYNIIYNKPELLKPEFEQELLRELSEYTGRNVVKVRIVRMDIGKCTSEIEISYRESLE
jgi:hypothetical protein